MDKVVHFEIPADGIDRAKNFYGSIFGWQLQTMPDMDYNDRADVGRRRAADAYRARRD